MFDPTAFENMKVVLEGAIYDLDLSGEILVTDRNDLINTAKMSRKFEIFFKLTERSSRVTAIIKLESELENLAAELLNNSTMKNRAGCSIHLQFCFEHNQQIVDYEKLTNVLFDIWGENRNITYSVSFYPLQNECKMMSSIMIEFDRLILEEQIDDLTSMVDFMITSIYRLEEMIPRT